MNKLDFRKLHGNIKDLGIGEVGVFYVYYIMYESSKDFNGVFCKSITKPHNQSSLETLFYPFKHETILSMFNTMKGLNLISEDLDGFIIINSLINAMASVKFETIIDEVLTQFNDICGTKFRITTEANRMAVRARLRDDKYEMNELIDVVRFKYKDWCDDKTMAQYLRPQTIFSPGKFQGYLNAMPKNRTNMIRVKTVGGVESLISKVQFERAEPGWFTKIED